MRRFALAALFAVVAFIALVMARASKPVAPTGDLAVLESYVLQAGHGQLLVGPYSRFQWHHPGPVYFYLLVPFYAAGGHQTAALNAAALVMNLTAIALALGVLVYAGPPGLGVACGLVVAVLAGRMPDLLVSPWNPHIIVLPLIALVVTAAAAAAGHAWLLPAVAAAASFISQTDVGVVPAALWIGAASVALCAVRERANQRERRTFISAIIATAVVLVVLWLPVLIEQITRTPGNISELWGFFAHGGHGGQPFRTAFVAWTDMLAAPFRPSFYLAHGAPLRRSHDAVTQAWAVGQMIALAGIGVSSALSERRFLAVMSVLLLTASGIALWSVTRVEGEIMDHEIFWISALGTLNAALIAGAAIEHARRRRGEPAPARWGGVAVALIALMAVIAISGLSKLNDVRASSLSPSPDTVAIARSTSAIEAYLMREHITRPLIDIDQPSWNTAAGVLLELQKRGVPYAVDDDWLPMFTEMARRSGDEGAVLSISGAARHVVLSGRPGIVPIAAEAPIFVDALPIARAF